MVAEALTLAVVVLPVADYVHQAVVVVVDCWRRAVVEFAGIRSSRRTPFVELAAAVVAAAGAGDSLQHLAFAV